MSIFKFMDLHFTECKEIIDQIENYQFDSHDFIIKFMKKFESNYVIFLSEYSIEPFRNVNAQIGKFLSNNASKLSIMSIGETQSCNIFREVTSNELWGKYESGKIFIEKYNRTFNYSIAPSGNAYIEFNSVTYGPWNPKLVKTREDLIPSLEDCIQRAVRRGVSLLSLISNENL